ncbi:zinc ABC transporter substrate-binding protein AztC [Streptomonospora nanhaiensis]|uniref:Zinc/manganese transport system substrate-binding protein n=1 Tax=Streptomonospora nanhaiensis TaxID=1323731 RepID=A0A853BXB0_9ACTN|nr:zinc ABC transporter substrate-binding protein AztC [Streptomonospora nanhaiensis]MBV2364553.1 metal ABC transporter substrate-binding protein [Streptomonospora nanhaiensis]MBX9390194.1 metal ABC transporter substrate-binding protein [Streptomonospora nanhaiensis]NYI99097.1 zinc/manganese transport system substrate-binding protein [Streptomonospora nanhaiensis]
MVTPRPDRRPAAPRRAAAGAALLALAAATALSGCGAIAAERSGIVVTTNILGDLTRNVVGDEAEVTVLMRPNADPHSFAVSARQAAELEDAALIVYNGLGLEEGVLRNVEAAEAAGTPSLAVGEGVDPISYTEGETAGAPDPHFWTDPVRAGEAVDLIADAVVEQVGGVDPDRVRANARAYRERVEEAHAHAQERFGAIPDDRRRLVTNHHVFGYLAQRYDFEVVGAVIPSGTTLASPSGSDLDSLATAVEESGVPAVFADSSQPDRLARVMAEEAGLEIEVVPLFSESLTGPDGGAATYLEMTRHNTDAIAEGLTG